MAPRFWLTFSAPCAVVLFLATAVACAIAEDVPTAVGLHPTITLADVLAKQPPPRQRPGATVFEVSKVHALPEGFTGVSIERNDSGMVRLEWEYRQGKPHGRLLWYYASGARQGESIAQDGRDRGPWVMWYENGKVREQGAIGDNNSHHGEWVYYFPTGVKAAEGRFDCGRPWGTWKGYGEDGQLIAEGAYRGGEPWDGTFVVDHQVPWDEPYRHLPLRTFAAGKPSLPKREAERLVAVLAGTDDRAKPEALQKLAEVGAGGLAVVLAKHKETRMDSVVAEALIKELGQATPAKRKAARQHLLAAGGAAFAPLFAATTDPDPEIRFTAGELLQAIESRDMPLYFATAELASRLGKAGADALPVLVEMLSGRPEMQLAALKAISQIGRPEARSALPALRQCAQSSDAAVATEATAVIGLIAPLLPE